MSTNGQHAQDRKADRAQGDGPGPARGGGDGDGARREHGPDDGLGDRGPAEVLAGDGGEAQRDPAVKVQVGRNPEVVAAASMTTA